ncbi:MAG: AarF/ABC1/UbiB kinase family protein [Bdellovibrionales bacterium]|nr:AarF/ABC1/UbiB kinase family protein [Bdellovibrionales bacterium]
MGNNDGHIPKNRKTSLFSMAAKLVLKEGQSLLHRQAETRLKSMVEQADIVVSHVGKLKGAAMKAVQMLTIEAQDLLPPEVLQVLEKLQSQSPPMSGEIMMAQLKQELGEEKFSRLKDISIEPIAAASIGQVYSASLDGQEVVIKIQYPEIAESIESDLSTLKKLMGSLLFLFGKSIDLDDLFSEVERVLKLEADYLQEAENLKKYHQNFMHSSEYLVPQVFTEFSTSKILVLSRMEGLEFTDWIRQNPPQSERQIVGGHLLNLYMKELFQHQFVQTDPNPANFLINSKQQLVLLDFGATLFYSNEFVSKYKNLIQTVFRGEDEEIRYQVLAMEFISPKETLETQQKFVEFLKFSLVPFADQGQPFDFSQSDYSDQVRKKALEFSKMIRYSAPPKQLIFLHRKLGGIFQLLKRMGITADLRSYKQEILQSTSVESPSAQR